MDFFRRLASPALATAALILAIHCGGGGAPASAPLAAPSALVYPSPAILATAGRAIPPDLPTVKGTVTAWSVLPALPGGLTLDPVTGSVAGTPTAPSPQATYTVTAANSAGKATASLSITVAAAGAPGRKELACAELIQEHSEWCWAASSASILTWLGTPVRSCDVVNAVRNITYACGNTTFAWADAAANGPIEALYGPAPSVSALMGNYGHPGTGRASALTFAQVQAEINAGRPFFVNWAWSTGGAHILAGVGWDTTSGEEEMIIMDPWPNEGIKLVSYAWAVSGSDTGATHTWKWSLTVDP